MTDGSGGTRQSILYDAWGNERDRVGSSANRFTFGGHEKDEETGLLYAKARFYDSDSGRFLTQDTVLGRSADPPSLHRYSSAMANPLVFVDPTGRFSQSLAELARREKKRQESAEPTRVITDRDSFGSGRLSSFRPDAKPNVPDRGSQHPHSLEQQKELASKNQLGSRNVRFLFLDDPRQARVVDEMLGLDTTPEARIDAILRSRHRTLRTIRRIGKGGQFVGENTLVIIGGTADDITVIVSGKDLNEEEASRWLAVAGVILSGLSGGDLRKGKKLANAVDDKLDEAAALAKRTPPTKNTRQLSQEAHSVLDTRAQRHKTTAMNEVDDIDGNSHLILTSSDPTVPAVQKRWAEENGIEWVEGVGHAEETLVDAVDQDLFLDDIVQVDASRDLCPECDDLLKSKNIPTDTPRRP